MRKQRGAEETLFKLGLPPNHEPGVTGFRVYEMCGKIPNTGPSESDGHPLAD